MLSFPWRAVLASKKPVTVNGRAAEEVCLKLYVDKKAYEECDARKWGGKGCCKDNLYKLEIHAEQSSKCITARRAAYGVWTRHPVLGAGCRHQHPARQTAAKNRNQFRAEALIELMP